MKKPPHASGGCITTFPETLFSELQFRTSSSCPLGHRGVSSPGCRIPPGITPDALEHYTGVLGNVKGW